MDWRLASRSLEGEIAPVAQLDRALPAEKVALESCQARHLAKVAAFLRTCAAYGARCRAEMSFEAAVEMGGTRKSTRKPDRFNASQTMR